MANLLLHCGSESITRQELALVPTPTEGLGRFHRPYPYADYVDHVTDALNTYGLVVKDEQYGVLKDGARFFGLMEVEPAFRGNSHGQEVERDFGLMVGLRGSHDQSLGRGLAVGSNVFVCDNLSFSGEAKVETKQTLHIADRLPGLIMSAVETIPGLFEVQDNRFEAYKERTLKPRWGDAALVELVRREALVPSQLGRAIEYWDTPETPEQQEEDRTLWRLHNAVTAACKAPVDEDGKPSRPMVLSNWERTTKMTKFFDEIAGFDAVAA